MKIEESWEMFGLEMFSEALEHPLWVFTRCWETVTPWVSCFSGGLASRGTDCLGSELPFQGCFLYGTF